MDNQSEQQAEVKPGYTLLLAKQAAQEARDTAINLAAEIYGWSMKPVDRGQVIVGTREFEAVRDTAGIAYDVAIHEAEVAYYTAMAAAEEAYLAALKTASSPQGNNGKEREMIEVKFHIPCTARVETNDRGEAVTKALLSFTLMEREGIKSLEFKGEVAIHPGIVDSMEEIKEQ